MFDDKKEENRMYYELLEDEVFVKLDEEIPLPPVALTFGTHEYSTRKGSIISDTPMATYGNFSFVQAPPKSYKSYFVSLITSVYLSGNNKWGGNKFKGIRDNKRVLHFDTEQGKWHCQRSFRRTADMAGDYGKYETYSLRTIPYIHRMGFIEHKMYEHEGNDIGLVIIDGLADLVSDVNDIEQSNKCVQKLMEWSANKNCHIITVIHSNHGSDKPTGHLGSFCEKKAETQISLSREEDSNIIQVKCKRSRNHSFEDFEFKINNYGFPEVISSEFPYLNY